MTKPRIFVLDMYCEDCGAHAGEECVKPNGAPFAGCYSGSDGPITRTFDTRNGPITIHGRPTQYHAARRALFKHTRALVELGLSGRT